jgi:hypothetical protein
MANINNMAANATAFPKGPFFPFRLTVSRRTSGLQSSNRNKPGIALFLSASCATLFSQAVDFE